MTLKLLTEHHLEFLRFKGGYTGLSESTLVKMPLLKITCHGSYPLLLQRNSFASRGDEVRTSILKETFRH